MTHSLVELSDRSMPGNERHTFGDWICRAANGVTGRSNSCTPLGEADAELTQAVANIERWYRTRGLRPLFQVWDGVDGQLVRELDRRGYATGEGAEVLTRSLADSNWTTPSAAIEIIPGREGQIEGIEISERLEELAMSLLPKVVATSLTRDVDGPVSSGIGVIDDAAMGIFAMRTAPSSQREGLGSAVLASLLAAGVAEGAAMAWLQVMPTNESAKRLYERFGFEIAHRYHYRAAPLP